MQANKISNTLLECSFCGKSCHNIPECPLSESFTDMTSNDISNRGLLWGDNQRSTAFSLLSPSNSYPRMEDINTTTSTSQSSEINKLLATNVSISTISDMERTQIVALSDLLGKITDQSHASPYKSLDEAGRR